MTLGRQDRRILPDTLRERVLITIETGEGYEGVLADFDDDVYLVKPAAGAPILYYGLDSTEPQPVDRGDILVPSGKVLFIQSLGK